MPFSADLGASINGVSPARLDEGARQRKEMRRVSGVSPSQLYSYSHYAQVVIFGPGSVMYGSDAYRDRTGKGIDVEKLLEANFIYDKICGHEG